METYNAKLISADFEESTVELEIQHEFTVRAGEYVILEKADYDSFLVAQWNAAIEAAQDKTFDLGAQADNLISDAICQQLITELRKLKK